MDVNKQYQDLYDNEVERAARQEAFLAFEDYSRAWFEDQRRKLIHPDLEKFPFCHIVVYKPTIFTIKNAPGYKNKFDNESFKKLRNEEFNKLKKDFHEKYG